VSCEAYDPQSDFTLRSNAEPQTPRHASSSVVGSLWDPKLRGVTAF
jgi:hypothetical protein